MPASSTPVLITGASGFLALHTIIQLLEQGYKVRGTMRTLIRESEVRETVGKHIQADERLEFVTADLLQDSGWEQAVQGCKYVLHLASPFPLFAPKHEDDLIIPAVQGTQRVLRAAHNAKIKRVVIVSSNAAISAGHNGENRSFDETDWSIVENDIDAYSKSKTVAEREAWAFIHGAENTNQLEMVSINPPLILGPVLTKQFNTSAEMIRVFMRGEVPGVARLKMAIVDVRDVASAIVLAMTTPEAAGNRFACPTATLWYKEIVDILYREFAGQGYRIPRIVFPGFLVRLMALLDKKVALVSRGVDWDYELANEKIKRVLKWSPRTKEEAIISMAKSLIEKGFLSDA